MVGFVRRLIVACIGIAGFSPLTATGARAVLISGTGPYSGPPGFERGMASTMYCGNSPESWVRASAGLDTASGQLTMNIQLETDSLLAGPKGKADVAGPSENQFRGVCIRLSCALKMQV